MSRESFNKIVLTLLEGSVTLYPAADDGSPVLDSPLWTGAPAEGLTVRQRWLKQETRPTGRRYPKKHPLIPEYEIIIDRVWQLPMDQLEGFAAEHSEYVLDVVWQDEDGGQWHRQTFYGVTISERNLTTREIDTGSTDGQTFEAETMVADGGLTGPIPALTAEQPYRVIWRGEDGVVPLYSYNATTHQFTALAETDGRATIAYDAGVWEVAFDGEDPAVISTVTGLSAVLLQAMPDNAQIPRLDFMYGNTRVASITAEGLWAREFLADAPAAGSARYQIYKDAALVATLAAPRVTADVYDEPEP
jgi:hypothetical protein